jgi:hypothetical protein
VGASAQENGDDAAASVGAPVTCGDGAARRREERRKRTIFDDVLCPSIRSLHAHVLVCASSVASRAFERSCDLAEARAAIDRCLDDRAVRVLMRGVPFADTPVVRARLREDALQHFEWLVRRFGQPGPVSQREVRARRHALEALIATDHRRVERDEVLAAASLLAVAILSFWKGTPGVGFVVLLGGSASLGAAYVLRRIVPEVFIRRRERVFGVANADQQEEEASA